MHDPQGMVVNSCRVQTRAMKRIVTTTTLLRQAKRVADPLTGRVLEHVPGFDPALLPHLDWPISPALQRAVAQVVSDAIALQLSFADATAGVARVLGAFGIQLGPEELLAAVRCNTLGAI